MDESEAVNVSSEELSRLTPGDNRELQQFIQNENQKAQVQRCKLPFRLEHLSIRHSPIYHL